MDPSRKRSKVRTGVELVEEARDVAKAEAGWGRVVGADREDSSSELSLFGLPVQPLGMLVAELPGDGKVHVWRNQHLLYRKEFVKSTMKHDINMIIASNSGMQSKTSALLRLLCWVQVPQCGCIAATVARGQKCISGPLLDWSDTLRNIEVPRVEYDRLSDDRLGEPSSAIRQRVVVARDSLRSQARRSAETALLTNVDSSLLSGQAWGRPRCGCIASWTMRGGAC